LGLTMMEKNETVYYGKLRCRPPQAGRSGRPWLSLSLSLSSVASLLIPSDGDINVNQVE
jgi:hypothetical protein